MNKTRVYYFTVLDNAAKVKIICSTAEKHLRAKEPLLILAADKATLHFVDQLLWKEPPMGFIPHSTTPSDALITLTLPQTSFAGTTTLFNLTSLPIQPFQGLQTLYEFEDLTHPAKKAIFEKKFTTYQQAHFTLCSS